MAAAVKKTNTAATQASTQSDQTAAQFSPATFEFLTALAGNNHRDWFGVNKDRYGASVRAPFIRVIRARQPVFTSISAHYIASDKSVGGSLFRIHRDARFSSDKSPYKTWAGARFFHARSKVTAAPSFYLHIAPDDCFAGAGIWHPDAPTLRRIRDFLIENPESWRNAVHSKSFTARYTMGGGSLTRAPRGFDPTHPLIRDIQRTDFVAAMPLSDGLVQSAALLPKLSNIYKDLAPMVDYLCAALDLEF